MITICFDSHSEPIVSPGSFYGPQRHICDVCIVTFSTVILESVLSTFACERIAEIGACNGNVPIYAFPYQGRKIALYLSGNEANHWLDKFGLALQIGRGCEPGTVCKAIF